MATGVGNAVTDAVCMVSCLGVCKAIAHVCLCYTLVTDDEAEPIESDGVETACGKVTRVTDDNGLAPEMVTPDEDDSAAGHEEESDYVLVDIAATVVL